MGESEDRIKEIKGRTQSK